LIDVILEHQYTAAELKAAAQKIQAHKAALKRAKTKKTALKHIAEIWRYQGVLDSEAARN